MDIGGRLTVDANAIPPELKGYCPRNPTKINYKDERSTQRSMGWRNLTVGARSIHDISMAYINVVKSIATFVEPNPPTNINTNETILTQFNINQVLKIFIQKGKLVVKK